MLTEELINQSNSYLTKNQQKIKVQRKELQTAAYILLGNKCCKCGEKDSDVLTIDHIEPCGKNRLQQLKIYSAIIKDPENEKFTYQLLCRNCNWKKLIENNERRQLNEQPFAYQYQIAELDEKLRLIEEKLNRVSFTNRQGKKSILQIKNNDETKDKLTLSDLWKDTPISLTTLNDMIKRNFIESEKINGKVYIKKSVWEAFKKYNVKPSKLRSSP